MGQFEFRDAGKMERKNGDVALCPHFSSGPKFKMTHYLEFRIAWEPAAPELIPERSSLRITLGS